MAAASTDYFTEVGNPGSATTLAAPGHTIAGTSFTVVSTANWPTTTGVVFAVDTYTMQVVNGVSTAVRTPGSYTEWEGVVSSSTQITGAVLRYGTDQNYSAGSTTRVYIPVASSFLNRFSQGVRLHANQDGSLITAAVQTALGLGTGALNGWNPLVGTPNTVTSNGNRSYTCVFNSTDLTATLSPGMRLRTTRTVVAPTQSTSLNGTTQSWSKTSPAGMTFVDNFVVSAWVKLNAYNAGAEQDIVSRYNGTSGWNFYIDPTGRPTMAGFNAGSGNFAVVSAYQSIPLNKWVHITGQLAMAAGTTTPTTNYFMIDGVDVPVVFSRGGTSPTALVQAGNLEVGSRNGGVQNFNGKIAQAAIYSAKVTQSAIQATISQGLAGTETSLISAHSFNGTANDLNTTNANNLTANDSAVATNADSPFGGQAGGTISSTLDYGIIQSVSFSTNTTVVVQVPEGCTIPTSGGVSAVAYSSVKVPYGFSIDEDKWSLYSIYLTTISNGSTANGATANPGNWQIYTPTGAWRGSLEAAQYSLRGSAGTIDIRGNISTTVSSTLAVGVGNGNFSSYTYTSADNAPWINHGFRFTTTSATPLYVNLRNQSGVVLSDMGWINTFGQGVLSLVNSYL